MAVVRTFRYINIFIVYTVWLVVDGLCTSKIRYWLQLYGIVRKSILDPVSSDIKAIQLAQNKILRYLNGIKLLDKVSTATLLEKSNMLSVNQLKIKLLEIWKSLFSENSKCFLYVC